MSEEHTKPTPGGERNELDDDLDDLDDVLEEFAPVQSPPNPSQLPIASTISNRPRTNTRVGAPPQSIPGTGPKLGPTEEENLDEDVLSKEFASELAKGMESLMKELMSGHDPSSSTSHEQSGAGGDEELGDEEAMKAIKAAWEAMLVEGVGANAGQGDPLSGSSTGDSKNSGAGASSSGFQDTIKQTLDKLKKSESNLQSGSGSTNAGTTESLEDLLKSLGDMGISEDGEESKELTGFLEDMMGQLMSREVLYEPLKELAENFPGYLANPPKPIEPADKTRYEKQHTCVKQIIEIFEDPTYSNTNAATSTTIMNLMSEMQTQGSPPPEIMGPLPPDFENGFPPLGDNCIIM